MSLSTKRKCNWAVNIFNQWKAWRNERTIQQGGLGNSIIRTELVEMTKDELCFSLTRFILEAKKANGEPYPAETLYEIVISLQLHLSVHRREMKLINDPEFVTLKNTLDSRMKDLASEGICVRRKQAAIITEDEEEKMWRSGVLGDDTPRKLLDTVIYLCGLNFALWAGQEHTNLRFDNSQITLLENSSGVRFLRYTEDVSKTRQGGLKHRRIAPKIVDAYENLANPERCFVRLYTKYLFHRPTTKCNSSFYLGPLDKPTTDVWYRCQALGINQISKTVKRMCQSAGIGGHRTNHSLRATAASRLYAKNFDEQLICETTGHRSSSVRQYKRTSDDQRKAISAGLRSTSTTVTGSADPTHIVVNPNGVDNEANPRAINLTVNINVNGNK